MCIHTSGGIHSLLTVKSFQSRLVRLPTKQNQGSSQHSS